MNTKSKMAGEIDRLLKEMELYQSRIVKYTLQEAQKYAGDNPIEEINDSGVKKYVFDNPEKPPTPEEILTYTQLEMAYNIRSLKRMMTFLVVLAVVGLIFGFIGGIVLYEYYLNLLDKMKYFRFY